MHCGKLFCLFRAAETSQDVQSLRPPRFIHEDGVIRPYREREGIGSQMLQVTFFFIIIILKVHPIHRVCSRSKLSDKSRLLKYLFTLLILTFNVS